MREIKFRAWDTKDKRWLEDFILGYDGVVLANEVCSWKGMYGYEPVLMQYTGLKDKNGKEIYEGDIVQYGHGNYKHTERFVVEFDPDGYGVLSESTYACKVIGNIYENPELSQQREKGKE